MKNLKLNILLLMVFSISLLNGQRYFDERHVYNQAFLNPTFLNPGAISANEGQNISLNYKNQWASFPGSPKTVTISYEGRVAEKLGINVLILQDKFSALQTSKGQLGFSYNIATPTNKIGFGISAEYIKHGLNNFGINNTTTNEDDPLLKERRAGIDYVDASVGVFGVYDEKFTYGIALPSLVSARLDESTSDEKRDLGFILNLGYKVKSMSSGISLMPSVWVKKLNNVPTHVDLNLNAGFLNDLLLGGINYRVGAEKSLGFNIGAKVDKVGFFYTYNVSSSQFQQLNSGGHEMTARISFGGSKAKIAE
jgi:type IX secretion system PorP/SprF family membrane protein